MAKYTISINKCLSEIHNNGERLPVWGATQCWQTYLLKKTNCIGVLVSPELSRPLVSKQIKKTAVGKYTRCGYTDVRCPQLAKMADPIKIRFAECSKVFKQIHKTIGKSVEGENIPNPLLTHCFCRTSVMAEWFAGRLFAVACVRRLLPGGSLSVFEGVLQCSCVSYVPIHRHIYVNIYKTIYI